MARRQRPVPFASRWPYNNYGGQAHNGPPEMQTHALFATDSQQLAPKPAKNYIFCHFWCVCECRASTHKKRLKQRKLQQGNAVRCHNNSR